MSKLDVLFVIPANVLDIRGGVPDAIEPPAKARFMLAYLLRRNVSVELFDTNITNDTPEEMARKVVVADPHLVVMPVYGYNPSASTQTMVSARRFAEEVKKLVPHLPIIFTGTHPAAVPEITLLTEPAVDYVCGGEGPITVHELLQTIKAGSRVEDIHNVRSLWYREDNAVRHNLEAPLIDLNQEPALPGWKYMDPRKYRPHHWQRFYKVLGPNGEFLDEPYANPYSVEGCPFHCDFCNIQAPYREGEKIASRLNLLKSATNSFRRVSPDTFVEEVAYLVEEYGVRFFKIPDEMYGIGSHPMEVAKLVRDRFGDSLNFWCYFRIDTCKPQHLDLLRSAGFRWISLGIEAADSKVRSGQNKKFGEETIYKVVDKVHAAGIEGAMNYIFGLPGETMKSMEATLKLAGDLNGTYGNFYCTQALPGSKLYSNAKAKSYPLPERLGGPGWIGHAQYSEESEPFYDGHVLTPAQILAFRDWAQVFYYSRPEYKERLGRLHGAETVQSIDAWILVMKSLKRNLFGGKSFFELPKEEQVKLVPASSST